jgi:5-formyltetrahydrofolate cyclo-ligase
LQLQKRRLMKIQELKETLENKSKAEIRGIIREHRNSMSAEEVTKRSANVRNRLYTLPEYTIAQNIMLYVSFRNEVDTTDIIAFALQQGKKVFLPGMARDGIDMDMFEIHDIQKDLAPGRFGVMEPKHHLRKCAEYDRIYLCIMPGIAFDRRGNRIGWGKGYYDSFLRKLPSTVKKFALAYDFQVIKKIDAGKNDVPIDGLITESEILMFNREGSRQGLIFI